MSAAPAPPLATPDELRRLLRHRAVGAALLRGDGLEIGALHYPLAVNGGARVEYLDVEDSSALRRLFPELAADSIVEPRWIGDVVRASVPEITGRRFDFIVMNHVLEHVANPVQAIANVWEGLVDGGLLALAVPDMRFTFDRARRLTTFEHLVGEYYAGVDSVDSSHYVELLEALRPDVFADRERFRAALEETHQRREHVHVWDSDSFRLFWQGTARLLRLDAEVVYESNGRTNRFESFLVVRKSPVGIPPTEDTSLKVLAALYRTRADLQQAFPAAQAELAQRLLRWATTAGAGVDSDAPTLRPFQDFYRRLLSGTAAEQKRLDEILRRALAV